MERRNFWKFLTFLVVVLLISLLALGCARPKISKTERRYSGKVVEKEKGPSGFLDGPVYPLSVTVERRTSSGLERVVVAVDQEQFSSVLKGDIIEVKLDEYGEFESFKILKSGYRETK